MILADYEEFVRDDGHSAELVELHGETLRRLAYVLGIIGLVFVNPFYVFDHRTLEPMLLALALAVIAAATLKTVNKNTQVAAILLIGGSATVVTYAMHVYPSSPVACVFSLVVMAAGVLLGWRLGLASALVVSVVLLSARHTTPELIPDATFGAALFLAWTSALFGWLDRHPVQVALAWAWSSYAQSLRKTEEARDRQGELAEVSRRLSEAVHRLERTNEELERARKAAEEARRLKANFAASISHELRTPLNLIIGFTEMMVMQPEIYGVPLPSSYRGDVEAVYRNACHLSSLIDDVLDLGKIEAHRFGLMREPLRLESVVEEAVAAIKSMFLDKSLTLDVRLPSVLPVLNADRVRVRQILINLLSNAVRFTSRGGVTIGGASDGREVVVWVTDTGAGMATADLSHVFDEFYQIGGPNSRRGTGLGLTISKRFVELHGGSMWAESKPGDGTTFYFSLPITANVASVSIRDEWETWARALTGEATPRTVAVLDDDPEVVKVFQHYLDGYRVVPLSRESKLTEREPIHALVMTAPEHTGNGEHLPVAPGDLLYLPLITCPLRTNRTISRDMGVVEYLTKPIRRGQLFGVLKRLGKGVRTILIVDDDPEMVRLLTRMLEGGRRTGSRYHVLTASSGSEALQAMQVHRPDVLLLDLLMAGVDGYEVLEQMRCNDDLRDVPVVLVTAKGADENMIASELRIGRLSGLSVGEVMRCLGASLDALLRVSDQHSDLLPPVAPDV